MKILTCRRAPLLLLYSCTLWSKHSTAVYDSSGGHVQTVNDPEHLGQRLVVDQETHIENALRRSSH